MLATLFAAAALFAILLAVGPEHLWALFGPADLTNANLYIASVGPGRDQTIFV